MLGGRGRGVIRQPVARWQCLMVTPWHSQLAALIVRGERLVTRHTLLSSNIISLLARPGCCLAWKWSWFDWWSSGECWWCSTYKIRHNNTEQKLHLNTTFAKLQLCDQITRLVASSVCCREDQSEGETPVRTQWYAAINLEHGLLAYCLLFAVS